MPNQRPIKHFLWSLIWLPDDASTDNNSNSYYLFPSLTYAPDTVLSAAHTLDDWILISDPSRYYDYSHWVDEETEDGEVRELPQITQLGLMSEQSTLYLKILLWHWFSAEFQGGYLVKYRPFLHKSVLPLNNVSDLPMWFNEYVTWKLNIYLKFICIIFPGNGSWPE